MDPQSEGKVENWVKHDTGNDTQSLWQTICMHENPRLKTTYSH